MGRIFENVKPRFSDEDFQMVGFEPRLYRRKDIVLYNSYKKDGTGVMSNFYPCQIEYEGKTFNSAEQLLFYKDAVKWGDCFAGCLWDNSLGLYKGINACGRAMMRVRREGLEEEKKMVEEMEMACVGA